MNEKLTDVIAIVYKDVKSVYISKSKLDLSIKNRLNHQLHNRRNEANSRFHSNRRASNIAYNDFCKKHGPFETNDFEIDSWLKRLPESGVGIAIHVLEITYLNKGYVLLNGYVGGTKETKNV